MILSDKAIKRLIASGHLVIEPLRGDSIRENGVDLRLGTEFCVMKNIDKVFDTHSTNLNVPDFYHCEKVSKSSGFIIPPGRRVLATTMEYVRLANNLVGLVNLRSSFARSGIYIPPTVVDAGFEGELTIELVGSDFPVKVYPGQRFLHLILVHTLEDVEKPYSGTYTGQRGVRLPTLPIK